MGETGQRGTKSSPSTAARKKSKYMIPIFLALEFGGASAAGPVNSGLGGGRCGVNGALFKTGLLSGHAIIRPLMPILTPIFHGEALP